MAFEVQAECGTALQRNRYHGLQVTADCVAGLPAGAGEAAGGDRLIVIVRMNGSSWSSQLAQPFIANAVGPVANPFQRTTPAVWLLPGSNWPFDI
jgi:hypothetical protein